MDTVLLMYENHRGEKSRRHVRPIRLWFGSTAWHPDPQWLLEVCDIEKGATRDYAMGNIETWEVATSLNLALARAEAGNTPEGGPRR